MVDDAEIRFADINCIYFMCKYAGSVRQNDIREAIKDIRQDGGIAFRILPDLLCCQMTVIYPTKNFNISRMERNATYKVPSLPL